MRQNDTRHILSLVLTAAAMAGCGSAWAQTVPPTPPANVDLPTREEIEKPVTPAPLAAPRVKVDQAKAFEPAPCALSDSPYRAAINSVAFEGPGGMALVPEIAEVLDGFAPLTKGEQPVANVCEMRDRASYLLRNSGYVASVQIRAQDLSGGELRLVVVTARIAEIRVHGDAGKYRDLLDDRIDQLQALNPLNQFDAERILLLIGDVPGLDVSLSLRSAGTTPGAVIGDLTLTSIPYNVMVNAQNYGSEEVGPAAVYARTEVYGLTGHGDVTYLGLSSTTDGREQQIAQLGHMMALGRSGATIGGSLIAANSQPSLEGLDLRTQSTIAELELRVPVIRSMRYNLGLSTGLEVIEQKTRIYSNGQATNLNLDKLSIAYARVQGDVRYPETPFGGAFQGRAALEVRKGTELFDATAVPSNGPVNRPDKFTPSRSDGNSQATVVRFDTDASFGLGRWVTLAGTLRSQWADSPLLSYEEFSVGNLNIGRGYDPGANSGDSAIGLRGEIRFALPPHKAMNAEAFTFYDSVTLWNQDRGSTENGRTLESWGGGVRFFLPGRLIFDMMFAQPLDPALSIDNRRPDGRLMFSLTTQFLPRPN